MTGFVNSVQSFGAADGPGVRFIVFMQGCNLRCACCHNPETWSLDGGQKYTPQEIVEQVKKYREYFGKDGGITISGGEPLLQAEFCTEVFRLCKAEGIGTCLDTSGSVFNGNVKALLKLTDLVLLDIKFTSEEKYREYVGCDYPRVLDFLSYLKKEKIPLWLRQVVIPGLNTDRENFKKLNELGKGCEKIELLPFKKLCSAKYDLMKINFKLADNPEPTDKEMEEYKNELLRMC